MSLVVYGTGALLAAERSRREIFALHDELLRVGVSPIVPTPVLGQAWRGGGRQGSLARILKGCEIRPLDERTARYGGELLGSSGTADIVDAAVVALALNLSALVVTSDPGDLKHLTAAAGRPLALHAL
ncbi:twitching motility protein PilT [Streptomyces albus subsp. albus]|nr:twitching motility protein PilT [Streptomyces albus subsp. albus]